MKNLREVYGKSSENVIEYKENSIFFDNEVKREENMKKIMDNWKKIKEICDVYLPEAEKIKNLMKNSGAIYQPEELGICKEAFRKSFIAAKDIRKRYGVLQLLEDIGMLEDAAGYITNLYYL